jgi:hypothetical protein
MRAVSRHPQVRLEWVVEWRPVVLDGEEYVPDPYSLAGEDYLAVAHVTHLKVVDALEGER